MPNNELTKIKNFNDLLAYLRDQLDWPIDELEVDDLTYEYEPEELGIDPKNAAKIKQIKQLRPMSSQQPWGIFYIEFEPKKLPIVAMRRILSNLVTKKRTSAKNASKKTWNMDDLLFISNYGEGTQRHISFAHFSESPHGASLPSLKVLGWDADDTSLHLDHVVRKLHTNLCWPDDEGDVGIWRKKWQKAFTREHEISIKTAKELSVQLANLAKKIRGRVLNAITIETDQGPMRQLMATFKLALIHDLKEDGFADMYAQTIAYGLLSARVSRHVQGKEAVLCPDDPAALVLPTNPFLKEMLENFINLGGRRFDANRGRITGIDFDELGVNDVIDTLKLANMDAVLEDFRDRKPNEDPLIHFYEGFAKQYDPIDKIKRGEFYTPWQVVSFIVRSIDEQLRTEFKLKDGLADTTTWGEMAKRFDHINLPQEVTCDQPFVQILDPATGTATFLVEVINLIHKTMTQKWKDQGHKTKKITQLWNRYVPEHLLPRLHGYELKMAPYSIAHMTVSLKLRETGYKFGSNERVRIYLTNTLEPPQGFQITSAIPAFAHEADAVRTVKNKMRFTVILGNPPYAGISSNKGTWIDGLLKGSIPDGKGGHSPTASYYHIDGQPLGERNPKWLQDDYVKFTRWAQWQLERTGMGILGYITPHGYLDNPTFRGMRWAIMQAFDKIHVLDLHGNIKKKEKSPDKNVFDIQQGVSICLMVKGTE